MAPEWVLWTMEALRERGLEGKIFLWSDDNLSNWYFWEYLDRKQRQHIANFPNYARVGCFKGYDASSFTFNTLAASELFDQQFAIYRKLLEEGLEVYAYVTFTAMPHPGIQQAVARFVDKLQAIHPNLPLRTVPLKVDTFTPNLARLKQVHRDALQFQYEVHNAWLEELHQRFSEDVRHLPISGVQLRL